ncbi:MAG TPA: carboxypeptidase-like regulatory domain-containing protein [Terriglobia bacterium]|nr:carboxypeptidase-like regulatory domain-containing protein [Terriglobia bacterium]
MGIAHKCGGAALFLMMLVVCLGAWRMQAHSAQTLPLNSSAPQPRVPANCHISGLVVDAGTGKPMPSAEVKVFSPPVGFGGVIPVVVPTSPCVRCDQHGVLKYEVRTDATGHFAVQEMEPGIYAVSAVADGYAEQVFTVYENDMQTEEFSLGPGQARDDIVVRLPRASVLAGRVTDAHGEPVPGSLVQVLQYGPAGALQKMLLPVTGATTDDRGEYRVFGLLPGRYYLVAGYGPDFDLGAFNVYDLERKFYFVSSSQPVASWEAFPPLFFYPSGTDPNRARPVNLEAGQVVSDLNIPVRPMTAQERMPIEKAHLFPPLTGACEASGTVIDAATGQPMRNAWMFLGQEYYSLYQHPAVHTRTDGEGRFDLKSIPCEWRLPLAARANGFVEQPEKSEPGPPYFGEPKPQFRSQHKITGIEIKMTPTGVIAGKITDGYGNPVECAHVTLALAYPSSNTRGWLRPYRETVTDDLGRYRLFDLTAGQYYVAAQTRTAQPPATLPASTADLRLPGASRGVSVSPYIYYPHATTPGDDASLVRLAPGERLAAINFSLSPIPTYEISGTVQGAAWRAWRAWKAKVGLTLLPAEGAFGISLKSGEVVQPDDAGHFRILGVPPGSYVLWAVVPASTPRYAAYAPITVSHANVSGVTLDPDGDWTIHGHLTVEGQTQGDFQYRVIAERGDAGFLFDRVQANGVHSGDSFALNGLFPGRYRIRIEMAPERGYIKSATFGSQDVRANLLEIPQHQPVGTLELVVSWDAVQIQGTVLGPDGQPATSACVVLAPAPELRRDARLFRSVPTYSGGHFLMQGVPPGKYTLFALDKIAYGAWFQHGVLDAAAGYGVNVTVAAGQKQTVTLHEIDASSAAETR